MRKIILLMILLMGMNSTVWAGNENATSSNGQSSTSVVVFMDSNVLAENKVVEKIRGTLKEKFNYAKKIEVYGDDQPKSVEFLDFVEKVKSDPINENGSMKISANLLSEYGKNTNSNYVVLIKVSFFNSIQHGHGDVHGSVSVFDVSSDKYVESQSWYADENGAWMSGAQQVISKIATNFQWSPSSKIAKDNEIINLGEKKPSAVVILPSVILEKPEAVEKVKKTILEKFQVKDLSIYADDRPKSSEFLNLIEKIGTDSAKQKSLVLKKEHLVAYGIETNSNPVIAIVISVTGRDTYFSYSLKEDVYVIDSELNKYLANVTYNTDGNVKRTKGIEYLMKKLQTEFKLP